eukprot:COSAG01_NODE_10405_length_2174_cov_193.931084_2_plen_220_part_00
MRAQETIVVHKDKVAVVTQSPDNDAEVMLRYVGKRSPSQNYVRAARLVKASDEEQRDAVTPLFPKVNSSFFFDSYNATHCVCGQGLAVIYQGKSAVIASNPDREAEVLLTITGVGNRFVRAALLVPEADGRPRIPCSACGISQGEEAYSKNQWHNKAEGQKRCRTCVQNELFGSSHVGTPTIQCAQCYEHKTRKHFSVNQWQYKPEGSKRCKVCVQATC